MSSPVAKNNGPGSTGPDHKVADARAGNWVDRRAPKTWRPYLRLMRADRPIGFWLLFWPCAWSLALASWKQEDPWFSGAFIPHLALFFAGAVVMRGAGCVWNDITDRKIDAKVARTRSRPLPSGQVTLLHALIFMVGLLLTGLIVLLQFNRFTVLLGFGSLLIVAVYPFMKRLTNWPQSVLGLALAWGALMGWSARNGAIETPALVLFAGCVFWIMGYDTIYAHQDKEDDALIGMKSTALHFGAKTKSWLVFFYAAAGLLIATAALMVAYYKSTGLWINRWGISLPMAVMLGVGLFAGVGQLAWQILTLDIDDAENCLKRFRSNHYFGMLVFTVIVLAWLMSAYA